MDAPLKLIRHDDREIAFQYRANGNWILVGFAGLMVSLALAGHGPGKLGVRISVFIVGSVVACLGLGGALWRESLTLDIVNRRYQRASGYVWRISRQIESLDRIETVTFSMSIRAGGRSGTYTVWVVGLRFRQPVAAANIEGFKTEVDARELIQLLTRTLHVPFIDRTVSPARQVEWKDVGKPLIVRPSNETTGHISPPAQLPAPPSASKIELTQVGAHRVITLPTPGFRADAVLVIAFTSVFLWLGFRTLRGMVEAIRAGSEHYWLGWVIGSSLFLIGISGVLHGISLILAREYVRDDGNILMLGKRILGIGYGKAAVAKDAIMDVAICAAESAEGDRAHLQEAMREKLASLGSWQTSVAILTKEGRRQFGVTLSTVEQQWLAEAVRAMCQSRA
jgi:hypothetical protein